MMENFLRNFGHLMKELRVVCENISSFSWVEMASLIGSTCTTLKQLHLFNNIACDDPIEFLIRKVKRKKNILRNPLVFANRCSTLERLTVDNIYIDSKFFKVNAFFPNLRSLDLLLIGASDPTFIEVTIPNLEHLGITMADDYDLPSPPSSSAASDDYDFDETKEFEHEEDAEDKGNDESEGAKCKENLAATKAQFSVDNVKNALALNPQLKSIDLKMNVGIPIIEFINEKLPELKKIDLTLQENDFNEHNLKNDIVFKNVKTANLGVLGKATPPILFEQLEEIEFTTAAHESTMDFIKKHESHLKCLHLNCQYSDHQAFKTVKSLESLSDLYMIIENDVKWTARGLIRFLAECERLQTLMLMVAVNATDQKNWRSLVARIWEIDEAYNQETFTILKTSL